MRKDAAPRHAFDLARLDVYVQRLDGRDGEDAQLPEAARHNVRTFDVSRLVEHRVQLRFHLMQDGHAEGQASTRRRGITGRGVRGKHVLRLAPLGMYLRDGGEDRQLCLVVPGQDGGDALLAGDPIVWGAAELDGQVNKGRRNRDSVEDVAQKPGPAIKSEGA